MQLRVSDVARRYGVSPIAVGDWIRTGQLPATKTSDGPTAPYLVEETDLEGFVPPRRGPRTNRYRELAEMILTVWSPDYPPRYAADLARPFAEVVKFFHEPRHPDQEDYLAGFEESAVGFWKAAMRGNLPGRAVGTIDDARAFGAHVYYEIYQGMCKGEMATFWSKRHTMTNAAASVVEDILQGHSWPSKEIE